MFLGCKHQLPASSVTVSLLSVYIAVTNHANTYGLARYYQGKQHYVRGLAKINIVHTFHAMVEASHDQCVVYLP